MRLKYLFVFSLLLILSGCSNSSEDLQKVTLMLDYTPNTNHTGIYAADSLGYYQDAGIDLEIIQPSDVATESVVASGAAQFGISYGENVAQFDQEDDSLESIYAILNTNTSGFLSRADRNITRPKDFEGKTYCGWGSSIESSLINTLVEADGGDPAKVNMITASSNLMSENDECDFVWAYEGWDKINLESNNIEVNYIPFSDYGVDWYTPVIITSNDYISSNPDTVKAFIEATQKGYEYAAKHPDESSDMLLQAAPELDSDLVTKSQQFLSDYYQTAGENFGYQDPQIWSDFTTWLNDNKIITETDSTKFYTNDYI